MCAFSLFQPLQQTLTHICLDLCVCRISNHIVQLMGVYTHIVQEVICIHIRCSSHTAMYAGSVNRVSEVGSADAAANTALGDLCKDLVGSALVVLLLEYVNQVLTDHLVAYIDTGQSQEGLGQALSADQLLNNLAALEGTTGDDQRHMEAAVMAGTLVIVITEQVVVGITGLEVRTVVSSEDDDGVIVQALLLQLGNQLTQILVQAGALAQVFGIFFGSIASQGLQVSGQNEVCVLLL